MAAEEGSAAPATMAPIGFAQARASQPSGLEQTIDIVNEQIAAVRSDGRLAGSGPTFVGIGASLAAACAATWVLRTRGVDAWRSAAGDLPLPYPQSDHPVVAVSQSGRSPETMAVLESIDRQRRYAVTNLRPSPLSDLAEVSLWLGGHDDSFASTIGYTATVLGLGLLADAWDGGEADPEWTMVPALVESTMHESHERIRELAELFESATSVDVVGAGPSLGSAEGGALLFREVARLPATGVSTRTYLHGAMESASRTVHVVLGGTDEAGLCHSLADAGHEVIFITPEPVRASAHLHHLSVPRLGPGPRAVIEAVLLQGLTSEAATRAGIDADEFVFHNPSTKVAVSDSVRSS